jgi:hypothetical protein
MGIWRSLVRAVLSDYGLIGRAIADKIDPERASSRSTRRLNDKRHP